MTPSESESLPLDWFQPFYMAILHGNYAASAVKGEDERARFDQSVRDALPVLPSSWVGRLIDSTWRESMTGSWFAGVRGFSEYRDRIGGLLLASSTCFAGQAHTLAMARFADTASAEYLERYLDIYLPRRDCEYDQDWVMPALLWLDEARGESRAERFLVPGGLWEQFTADKMRHSTRWSLPHCISRFGQVMRYVARFDAPSR